MSTTTLVTQKTVGTPAPLPHTPVGTTTLVLMAFAAVYVVWGATFLAIRIGIESFPPLILAGLRHITVGLFLYPILRQWRRELGGTDGAFRYRGAAGGHGIALVGHRGLAPPWWRKARSQGGYGTSDGISGPCAAGRACTSGRLGAR